jgi:hypothetical protein
MNTLPQQPMGAREKRSPWHTWRWMLGVLLLLCVSAVRGAEDAGAEKPAKFVAMDVLLDTGAQALGAYQIEINAGKAVLVGVEGGEGVYADAPFYDPAALAHGRVVVAAFHVGGDLPHGKMRIARVHWALPEGAAPEVTGKLVVATDGAGNQIHTSVQVVPFEGDR